MAAAAVVGVAAAAAVAGLAGISLLLAGARLAVHVAVAATAGALLWGLLLHPDRSRLLAGRPRGAVRAAACCAAAWAVASTAVAVLAALDARGSGDAGPAAVGLADLAALGAVRASLLAALLAAATAVAAARVRHREAAVQVAAPVAVGALLPAAAGHGSGESGHSFAVLALAVHVAAAVVWTGGLAALLVAGRNTPAARLAQQVRTFGPLALVGAAGVALSGAATATLVLLASPRPVSQLASSPYAVLVVVKVVALGLAVWCGWLHRRRTVPALERGAPRAFARLAAVEVGVLAVAMAVASALARTPPP